MSADPGRLVPARRKTFRPKRAVASQRAGTKINVNECIIVYATIRGKRKESGHIDPVQRLYQNGGELRNFVYWKRKGISFDYHVWNEIVRSYTVDRLEMIDHDKNEVYRIAIEAAVQTAETYFDAIGPRVAVPLSGWDRYDAQNRLISGPSADTIGGLDT